MAAASTEPYVPYAPPVKALDSPAPLEKQILWEPHDSGPQFDDNGRRIRGKSTDGAEPVVAANPKVAALEPPKPTPPKKMWSAASEGPKFDKQCVIAANPSCICALPHAVAGNGGGRLQ